MVDPIITAPNDLLTCDFTGRFRTQDRVYCYPLTIADLHCRFFLTCHGLPSVHGALALPVFERTFREYGLPLAMRSDNGAPFVTQALCGLSTLTVWWMRLKIQHQRIHPASRQENGAHERLHRTLKREAIAPPRANMRTQHRAFAAFRRESNDERPHSCHGGTPPGPHYTLSPRPYPSTLPPLEYSGHFLVKRVTDAGTIRFQSRLLYLATALDTHHVASKKSTMASGRFTSAACCSRASMSAMVSSTHGPVSTHPSGTHVPGLKWHLCARLFSASIVVKVRIESRN